jgi:hypothetical protein
MQLETFWQLQQEQKIHNSKASGPPSTVHATVVLPVSPAAAAGPVSVWCNWLCLLLPLDVLAILPGNLQAIICCCCTAASCCYTPEFAVGLLGYLQ